MGWTCQYDLSGFCKRVKAPCVPGMKGCTLQNSGYTFSSELPKSYEIDEEREVIKREEFRTKEEFKDFSNRF